MIDHMLITRNLLAHYRGSEIHNELLHNESVAFGTDRKYPESDHAPVVAVSTSPERTSAKRTPPRPLWGVIPIGPGFDLGVRPAVSYRALEPQEFLHQVGELTGRALIVGGPSPRRRYKGGHLAGSDLAQDGEQAGQVAGAGGGQSRMAGLVLAEDAQVDVTDQGFVLARVLAAGTLDGGDATDEGSDLGVAALRSSGQGGQEAVLHLTDPTERKKGGLLLRLPRACWGRFSSARSIVFRTTDSADQTNHQLGKAWTARARQDA